MILSGHARDWSKGFDVARTATLYIGVTEIADLLKATHSSVATTSAPRDPSTQLCNLTFTDAAPLPLMPSSLVTEYGPVVDATFGYVDDYPIGMLFAGGVLKADSGKSMSVKLTLDYGAAGVALTTIAPTLGAFLDGTFASTVSYRVVADGVDAIAQTSVVPSGQTLSLAINKTVKILEIIITVTNGGVVFSNLLPNTSTKQAGDPVAPFKGLLLDAWGGNVIKFPSLAIVYGTIVGGVAVEPVF